METTRLSTKGQIVLPKSIRTSRAWKAGTEFTVEETRDGVLLKPAAAIPKITLAQLDEALRPIRERLAKRAGMRKKPVTLAEMKTAIAADAVNVFVRLIAEEDDPEQEDYSAVEGAQAL